MPIVSFFDQFPEFCGVKIQVRGDDGYFDATQMGDAMEAFDGKKRRFNNWTRSDSTTRLLNRLSEKTRIPVTHESLGAQNLDTQNRASKQKPLIDWVPGRGNRVWVHPYVAMAYAMSLPEFQADVVIWLANLNRMGTVNPHVLTWTIEEYQRGLEFNRDDVRDMYGR